MLTFSTDFTSSSSGLRSMRDRGHILLDEAGRSGNLNPDDQLVVIRPDRVITGVSKVEADLKKQLVSVQGTGMTFPYP